MEDPPMPDFSISQRLQQMAQVAPENLAAHEIELLAEYHEKKARFDQGPMRDYSEKIKRQLNDLQRMVEKNSFLKKMLA
jgi:hypothetical protein